MSPTKGVNFIWLSSQNSSFPAKYIFYIMQIFFFFFSISILNESIALIYTKPYVIKLDIYFPWKNKNTDKSLPKYGKVEITSVRDINPYAF